MIPTISSSPQVVERETQVTKDTVPPTNNGSTKDVQPPVVQIKTQVPNFESVFALVVEPVEGPVSALKPNPKPSIPYPSRLNDQKLRDKANDQKEKFFQIFQDLNFNISFMDALILMPKYRDTINVAASGTFMKRCPEECYDQMENMTAHHNDSDTSVQQSESCSSITSSSDPEIVALKAKMAKINKNLMKPPLAKLRTYMLREPIIKVVILNNLKTNMTSLTNSNLELKNMFGQFRKMNNASSSGLGTLPMKRETEVTKDMVPPTNNENTKDVQPSIVQIETLVPNFKLVVAPDVALVSAPKPNPKPSIPYPSRLHNQKLRDKAYDKKEKFFKIFQNLNFNISFAEALILMPKFGVAIKSLLTNKDKLFELARTPLNEHCSAVHLKKLPEKLGDPEKFLILSFPSRTVSYVMNLKLVDRSISRPVGVAKDVFAKVGTFDFSAYFVVVDFDADPRVSLILKRFFLKTGHALIDVYKGELTLCVGKEAVTFNLDQTARYSTNYDAMSVNQIDLIDVAYEEYSQEVLGYSMCGNPTPSTEPIVSNSSPTPNPFRESDFLLKEIEAFLAIDDVPISPEINESYYDSEGSILPLE
nr:reverse transcriptase domain-containing protein [Tanacetum cinerariifolium]